VRHEEFYVYTHEKIKYLNNTVKTNHVENHRIPKGKNSNTVVQEEVGKWLGGLIFFFRKTLTVLFLSTLVTSSKNEHEKMVSPLRDAVWMRANVWKYNSLAKRGVMQRTHHNNHYQLHLEFRKLTKICLLLLPFFILNSFVLITIKSLWYLTSSLWRVLRWQPS
jgi:hypothetical protein